MDYITDSEKHGAPLKALRMINASTDRESAPIRAQLWANIILSAIEHSGEVSKEALAVADKAVEEFNNRFNPQVFNVDSNGAPYDDYRSEPIKPLPNGLSQKAYERLKENR